MKKLFLLLIVICLNFNLQSAIGDGMRGDNFCCPALEDDYCNGYCC